MNSQPSNRAVFIPPQTLPLRQALGVLRSPYLGGVILAFLVITRFWSAGFDASLYYLRWPPENATTPYWVYLATYPLSWLGWPLSWQVLVVATIIVASVFYAMRGNRRWWLVVASSPMLFNAWWGQVEIFTLLGLATGLLVLEKKLHPVWFGAAWLLLGIKIQTNYGLILLFTFWFWRERGWRALLPAALLSTGVFALTLLIWPGWILRLFNVYGKTWFGFANASLWPYGLIAWPLALLPAPVDSSRRLRMVAAASLLGTPYFTLHHCLALMTLSDYPVVLAISWLPMLMIFQTRDWSMYAWVIPAAILAIDLYKTYQVSRTRKLTSTPQ
jgi:hypothetical protein